MYTDNWFKLHRKIFENEVWMDLKLFRFFVYLIGQAVFAKNGIKKGNIYIKRGQLLKSYRKIQDELEYIENNSIKKYSLSTIKRMVEKLEEKEMIKTESTQLGTLFTIVNYTKYQDKEQEKEQKIKELRTELEQYRNSTGTPPEQQRNNNKNVKNVKKDKNDINYMSEIQKIYKSLPNNWEQLFKAYIDIYRQKNKTKKITDSKHHRLLSELYNIFQKMQFDFDGKTHELNQKTFKYGIDTIIKKEIDNLNYAKKVWINRLQKTKKKSKKYAAQDKQKELYDLDKLKAKGWNQ